MVAASKWASYLPGSRQRNVRLPLRIAPTLSIGVIIATVSPSALGSPLSAISFNSLAASCAAGAEISTLRAVASVESNFNPFAIRDNTTRESWTPSSADAAVSIAKARLTKGHSVDLGLMQINSANLAALRMTVSDAFDACHSLTAARDILLSAADAGSTETERQAAILISLSRYNTGRPLAGVANGYANRVILAQGAGPTGLLNPRTEPASKWDIWGAHGEESTSWVVTAKGSFEIERAGAQTSDARNEGRAPATPSEKGEPYELSAYQESEPNKP